MNIAVIGGAGYIGSHVCLALLDAGHTPIVFDNFSNSSPETLENLNITFTKGDIRDKFALDAFFANNDVKAVILLAALKSAPESMEKPGEYMEVNIQGTVNVCESMLGANIDKLIFSGSAAVYGDSQYTPIDEKHPTNPTNVYGYTKKEGEQIIDWYARLKNLKYASLRYFNAAGYDPEGRIARPAPGAVDVVSIIVRCALANKAFTIFGTDFETRDGTPVRDFIHVSDLAKAHVDSITALDNHNSFIVNLGSGEDHTIKEYCETAKEVIGDFHIQSGQPREGDIILSIADIKQAQQILQFKPKFSDPKTILKTMAATYRG